MKKAAIVMMSAVSLILAVSASVKLLHVPKVVEQLNGFGFDNHKVLVIGAGELAIAILFVVPRTRGIGLLLLSAFLGGAIATHFQHAESVIAPAALLTIAWIGSTIQNPEWLRRN